MSRTDNEHRSSRFLSDDDLTVTNLKIETSDEEYEDLEEPAVSETETEEEKEVEFDYVIPDETYKQHHRRRRHHHHHSSRHSSGHSVPTDRDADDFVYATPSKHSHHHHHHHHHHHKKHKKKMALWLKIVLIIVSVILGLAIIASATFFILREIGRNQMHDYNNLDIVLPVTDFPDENANVIDKGRTIEYNGTTYKLNENVMSVTFIGYKNDTEGASEGTFMGDAIYIIAIDDKTGKTSIIGVSRDTMLDVDVYSVEGRYIDTEVKQLAYAYSFGNEEVTGGQNVNASLTKLFFGLSLNNYFAIDLEAMEELNDAIGGVTVTSLMEFYSEEYGRTIAEGEEITLHGTDVEKYLRYRDLSYVESNNARMDRQQQYIKAFLSSIVPAAKKDLSTVTSLFGVVSKNAETNLDLPKVTYLATAALSHMKNASDVEYIRLTGPITKGDHAEMHLDDKDVLETMLKVFYIPVGESKTTATTAVEATEPAAAPSETAAPVKPTETVAAAQ